MTATAALWFLPAVIPLAFLITWHDLAAMKITNRMVIALVVVYAVIGPFAFGWPLYAWQWFHLPIVLVVCMALWALRVMGGGDAKLIAAMSPFFLVQDLDVILRIFAASLFAALLTHMFVRVTPLRQSVTHWKSWQTLRYFPKGFPLSMTLVLYLLFAAFLR